MRWCVLAMVGCVGAEAQQTPRWEYAVLHVTEDRVVVETRDGPAVGERPSNMKEQAVWDAAMQARRLPGKQDGNVAAMLSAAGDGGWEVVGLIDTHTAALLRTRQFLAKRHVP